MEENKVVKELIDIINRIESALNRGGFGLPFSEELYDDIIAKQRELNLDKSVDNAIKKRLNNQILIIKKSAISYCNQEIFIIKKNIDIIRDKIKEIVNKEEHDKYEERLKSIENIEYFTDIILNAQDKIYSNFNKVTEALIKTEFLIYDLNLFSAKYDYNGHNRFEYIINFEIPKLEGEIKKYGEGAQTNIRNSLIIDANIIKQKLRIIENNCPELDDYDFIQKVRQAINHIDMLINQINSSKKENNTEYFALKDKINLFIQELSINGSVNNEYLLQLETKYKQLLEEIETKFKSTNKQLYNNLRRYLNKASNLIDGLENKEPNKESKKDETTENTTTYHIEKKEDAKGFYQKYEKQILLASGIASMALINTFIGPVIIPTIIFANFVAANNHAIIRKINDILSSSINAIKSKSGVFTKANGITIDAKEAMDSLSKSIALIGQKSKNAAISLLDRIKKTAVKIRTKERNRSEEIKRKVKENIDNRKKELDSLKTVKLYYELILSGKSPEEFYKSKKLTDEEIHNLEEYSAYMTNLNNKGGVEHGR